MNGAKRIIVLASSSAMLLGLTGCSVIDSLNLGQLLRPGGAEEATASPASTPAPVATGGGPTPLDLSAATPATAFTMPAPVQTAPLTAPIGGQPGFGTPSGFGSPLQQQPVAPTPLVSTPLTVTPVTRTPTPMVGSVTYGAQPNPYAPRVPAAAAVPQLGLYQQPAAVPSATRATYQPATSPALPQTGLAAPNPYRPAATSTVTQTVPLQSTSAASTPSSSMNPSINPENLSQSTISAIQAALKTRGLYSDTVDGVWGSKSKAAMARFLASRGETSVTLDTLFGLGVSL